MESAATSTTTIPPPPPPPATPATTTTMITTTQPSTTLKTDYKSNYEIYPNQNMIYDSPRLGSHMLPAHPPPWAIQTFYRNSKVDELIKINSPADNAAATSKSSESVESFSSLLAPAWRYSPQKLKVKLLKKVELLKNAKPFQPSPIDPTQFV